MEIPVEATAHVTNEQDVTLEEVGAEPERTAPVPNGQAGAVEDLAAAGKAGRPSAEQTLRNKQRRDEELAEQRRCGIGLFSWPHTMRAIYLFIYFRLANMT